MRERRHFRIWEPDVWQRSREKPYVGRPVCHRYSEPTAFVTAAWLAARHERDYLVTDQDQELAWTVTHLGEVR